jgi:hypothetical protein
MKRLGTVVLILTMLAIPASADEFESVVKGIETHYGIRRMHPFLIGFGLFIAKPAMWGKGVSGLKVAVFENMNRTATSSSKELDQIVFASLGQKWQPFVRIESRRSGNTIVIYADHSGKKMRLIFTLMERNETVVMHIKVDASAAMRWFANPEDEAKGAAHKH